jgi:hypothetical protein
VLTVHPNEFEDRLQLLVSTFHSKITSVGTKLLRIQEVAYEYDCLKGCCAVSYSLIEINRRFRGLYCLSSVHWMMEAAVLSETSVNL